MNGAPPNIPPGITFINGENGTGPHQKPESTSKLPKRDKHGNGPANFKFNNQVTYSKTGNSMSSYNNTPGTNDGERGNQKVDYIKQFAPKRSTSNNKHKHEESKHINSHHSRAHSTLNKAQNGLQVNPQAFKSKFWLHICY